MIENERQYTVTSEQHRKMLLALTVLSATSPGLLADPRLGLVIDAVREQAGDLRKQLDEYEARG